MYPYAHKQAKQAPCRTKSTSLSKCQPAFKTAPHAPRFTTAKKAEDGEEKKPAAKSTFFGNFFPAMLLLS